MWRFYVDISYTDEVGMNTEAERLQFVIRFAEMNLESLRQGDWMNLRDDLCAFFADMSEHPIILFPMLPPLPQHFPEEDFRNLQADVRYIINNLVGVRDNDEDMRWLWDSGR